MKTVGMIGGVSWESTALYYEQINTAVNQELGGLNSAKLLISSLNYQELIDYKNDKNWAALAAILTEHAKILEQAGADGIALCCNTLHKVADAISNNLTIPFLHIADAAGNALKQSTITTVGLLGTQFTMEDGFYQQHLRHRFGIGVVTPSVDMSEQVDDIIYKELCIGKVTAVSKALLMKGIQILIEQGAQAILLGCTELGLILQQDDSPIPIFDTTVLHAKALVSFALSKKG